MPQLLFILNLWLPLEEKHVKVRVIILLAMLLSLSLTASGQTSRGTVSGIISDPTGAVIPSATIALISNETYVSRTTVSNDEGVYRFDAVDLGTYAVNITATNFVPVTRAGLIVSANQISSVDAQLSPSGPQIMMAITADAGTSLQTEAPVRGGNINVRQITELPFASRNPAELALTLPGVSSNRFSFAVSTFSVNGARGRSNNFLIDGTENNDIGFAGQGSQISNPDAVAEVSVQSSNYDAEFGRAGGAVINVITRSGGNDPHGTLSYLLDSTRDDAITSQESRNPLVVARGHKLPGTEQFFSGTFGSPIKRKRSFFFGAYQEQRRSRTGMVILTVPSAAGRATLRGVFPAGASRNLDTYLNLTDGTIADTQFFNIALGTLGGVNRGNIEFGTSTRSFPQTARDRQFLIRIDHKISGHDHLSARYLFDDAVDPTFSDVAFAGFEAGIKVRFQNFLLAETHVFPPNLTNELRLAYNRIPIDFPITSENPLASTLPRINITNVTSLGVPFNFPGGRVANNYVIQDTMTYLRGNHTLRFGLDLLEQRSRHAAPFAERGILTFANSTFGGQFFTGFANFVDNFGGASGSARRDFGSRVFYPALFRQAYFFQDRWRATPALTLTLGLRYENFGNPVNTLRTPSFTGLFNVDSVTLKGPFSEPNEVEDDNNNFAPTVGIAYAPSFTKGFLSRLIGENHTVFRAGYQIGYDSFFNSIAADAAGSSPNVVATFTVSTVSAANSRGLPNLTASFPLLARPLSPLDSQVLVVRRLRNPYYQRWSVGIQRELPSNTIADISYVGSKGTKLYINEDRNPLVPPALRVTPSGYTGPTSGRLDNLQGLRLIRTNGGASSYHSGQLSVTRRLIDGFTLTASYTYSKLIDNASEIFGFGNTLPLPARPSVLFGERLDRAVSLFDRTHRASFTYVYQLPFFKEQRGAMGHLLGGFEISGVTTFESGAPLNVFNGVDADGIGGNFDRPDFNPQGRPGVRAIPSAAANPSPTGFINPDNNASINPADAQYVGLPAGFGRTGNLGRNTLRTPGINNFNFNILKRTTITEDTRLEFRTEFYNIFNHPQYTVGSPFSIAPFTPDGGGISTDVFNSLPGTFLNPNTRFSDGGGRVIRYQLKFIF